MRRAHALLAAVIGTALLAGATACAASDEATAQRQRVAINMVVNDTTDAATFALHRLRANTLMHGPGEQLDSGTASMGGGAFGDEYRNGMRVMNVVRWPTLVGEDGTLRLVQLRRERDAERCARPVGNLEDRGGHRGVCGREGRRALRRRFDAQRAHLRAPGGLGHGPRLTRAEPELPATPSLRLRQSPPHSAT